jgi:hypothetical protein
VEHLAGRTGVVDRVAVIRRPLRRRIQLAIAALLVLLVAGVPLTPALADPQPVPYRLNPTYVGHPLHIPVLTYRHRHTVTAQPPDVTWDRNVAVFGFTRNNIDMVVVAPSISAFKNQTKTALLDIYRRDPKTGDWFGLGRVVGSGQNGAPAGELVQDEELQEA